MKVKFIGPCTTNTTRLDLNTTYTATESIYSDYYELEEVKGWMFLKNLFRRVA